MITVEFYPPCLTTPSYRIEKGNKWVNKYASKYEQVNTWKNK